MDSIAQLPAAERAVLFRETAAQMGIGDPVIVEKDFWVCWSLRRLFASRTTTPPIGTHHPPRLLFKGGTSLAKAFGCIDRFSEDVDLSFDHRDLGFVDARDPSTALSLTQAGRLIDELQRTCEHYLLTAVLPALYENFSAVLDSATDRALWDVHIDVDDPQTIGFRYPSAILNGDDDSVESYIRPIVRLEFGARSQPWPTHTQIIRPFVADVFPNHLQTPTTEVLVLDAERTFWEKVVLLHKEYHRPTVREPGHRLSRHYYDVAMMMETAIATSALSQLPLLAAVVEHTARYFRSGWANYSSAIPGSLRLAPHSALRDALEADYRRMAAMFLHTPPAFESVLQRIGSLEGQLNGVR